MKYYIYAAILVPLIIETAASFVQPPEASRERDTYMILRDSSGAPRMLVRVTGDVRLVKLFGQAWNGDLLLQRDAAKQPTVEK